MNELSPNVMELLCDETKLCHACCHVAMMDERGAFLRTGILRVKS